MFKYKSTKEALLEERRINERLRAENMKLRSDIDYLAMMCEVEMEDEDNDEV